MAPSSPNPFGDHTRISFALPSDGAVSLQVFDATGRLVRTLVSSTLPAGPHNVVWEGADEAGRPAPAGLYYYRLSTDAGVVNRSLVLMR
jgi:flagellar hook assembly protein FlgD